MVLWKSLLIEQDQRAGVSGETWWGETRKMGTLLIMKGLVYEAEAIHTLFSGALEKDQGLSSRLVFKFRLCPLPAVN